MTQSLVPLHFRRLTPRQHRVQQTGEPGVQVLPAQADQALAPLSPGPGQSGFPEQFRVVRQRGLRQIRAQFPAVDLTLGVRQMTDHPQPQRITQREEDARHGDVHGVRVVVVSRWGHGGSDLWAMPDTPMLLSAAEWPSCPCPDRGAFPSENTERCDHHPGSDTDPDQHGPAGPGREQHRRSDSAFGRTRSKLVTGRELGEHDDVVAPGQLRNRLLHNFGIGPRCRELSHVVQVSRGESSQTGEFFPQVVGQSLDDLRSPPLVLLPADDCLHAHPHQVHHQRECHRDRRQESQRRTSRSSRQCDRAQC